MTIGDNLKKLRKRLALTQQEFADKLKVSRSNIATYEVGKNNPADAVINLICREFNVNETWLRTGEGEMFAAQSREEEIDSAIRRLLSGESESFKRRLILVLSNLSEEHWGVLEEKLLEIAGIRGVFAETAAEIAPEKDIDAQVEEYRQRLILEKRQEAESSLSSEASEKMA